jgi:hypothetical protein
MVFYKRFLIHLFYLILLEYLIDSHPVRQKPDINLNTSHELYL